MTTTRPLLVATDLSPLSRHATQRAALLTSDILFRINETTFNASLLTQLRTIALLQQLVAGRRSAGHAEGARLFARMQALRLHLLDGGAALSDLGAASKTNTQWTFLTRLHALGRARAQHWLAEHGEAIGQRSSFDASTLLP